MPGRRPPGREYPGVVEVVPGAISIPSAVPRGMANAGSGMYDVDLPFPDPDFDSIMLSPLDPTAFAVNVSGEATGIYDLHNLDSHIYTKGIYYPGGAVDDNNIQWEVPVPYHMDPANPNILIRLHVAIP